MKLKFLAAVSAAVCIACIAVFSGCKASTDFILNTDENGNKYYVASCSGFANSLQGEYAIPAYYGEGENRAPVTQIASEGFAGTGITKLIIPNTVTHIGNMAFAYNYRLRSVEFEEGGSLKAISPGAFIGCSSMTKAVLPSTIEIIWNSAFEMCERLAEIEMPSALEKIGACAFRYCYALENVNFPQTLTTIGEQAFYYAGLKKVVIPDSVRDTVTVSKDENGEEKQTVIPAIGYGAFHSCTSMTLAVVGAGVKNITAGAFGYCTSLKELYLPAALEKVEGALFKDGEFLIGHAFHSASALTDVYYGGSQEQWEALKPNIDANAVKVKDAVSDNSALLNIQPKFGITYLPDS